MTRKVPPSSNGPEDSDDQRTVRWAPSQDASLADVMQQHAPDSSGAAVSIEGENAAPPDTAEAETLRGSGETIRRVVTAVAITVTTSTSPPPTGGNVSKEGPSHQLTVAPTEFTSKPEDRSPVWPRLKVEVQEYRAWEEQAWCGLDEHLLARFLAGQCSAEERQQVEAAAQKSESVRDCLELVTDVMAGNP